MTFTSAAAATASMQYPNGRHLAGADLVRNGIGLSLGGRTDCYRKLSVIYLPVKPPQADRSS